MKHNARSFKVFRYITVLTFISIPVFMNGCFVSTLYQDRQAWKDDQAMPDYVSRWLESGEQSAITSRIRSGAVDIGGGDRRAKLLKAMNYVMRNFTYENWTNENQFNVTADELYASKNLRGPSDFALVFLPLLRSSGIPARLVITMNVNWIADYKNNPHTPPQGHCFIEVYLEDRWYLFDPTFRWLYTHYRPDNPNYPRNEYFLKRGRDFWDMGIISRKDFVKQMTQAAKAHQERYVTPAYDTLKFNPDEFVEKGN